MLIHNDVAVSLPSRDTDDVSRNGKDRITIDVYQHTT